MTEAALPAASARAKTLSLSNRTLLNAGALVFVAGNAVWAAGLALPAAIIVLLGCAGVTALLFSARGRVDGGALDAPVNGGLLLACLALGFVVVVLGGEGHFFFTTDDWLTRDAVLADIVRHGWPVFYRIDGDAFYLRAPLGMYMIPGLIGQGLGLHAAHLAMLTQNALMFALIFYLAGAMSSGRAMAYLLVLYGGFDILPWMGGMVLDAMRTGAWALPARDVNWWASYFQYTDHFTQICFVPNHAICGWFFAVLALFAARREIDLATLGGVFAALLLWSPLAPLLAAPFMLYLAWRDRKAVAWARLAVGAAFGACFVPVALYLVAGAGAIRHGSPLENADFWPTYALFVLVELVHVVFLAALWPKIRDDWKPLLVIAALMLALLPLYSFGPSNDFTMRGATAPLFVVAFLFSAVFLELKPEQKLARVIGVLIIVIGAAKALIAFGIALLEPKWTASACNLVTASRQLSPAGLPTNYIDSIRRAPAWLLIAPPADAVFETVGTNWCWPDHPVFTSAETTAAAQPGPR
ncbi:hypothetical protein M2323_001798 [Rhodoblastus acidophilus]|uniref:hypothetical protein n=1 Tax=Rhodoblastus acidophilus TaxID=1074 RepID=UPI0022240DE6|nr:hypothetical protein [Rhodoblastus acidophilus]MCW2283770.1 hypothetical protein [Rhodoblastus acidophilus]MCW2332881.1 hypothetical protein [Rhodoblastus acidophilus]